MEYVDDPDVNLPSRDYTEPEQITNEDIEKAASECRDLWRLGRSAIQDLALAVEGAGVIVVREGTGIAQIEGLSAWSEALSTEEHESAAQSLMRSASGVFCLKNIKTY